MSYNHRTNAHRNAAGLPLTETGLKEDPSKSSPCLSGCCCLSSASRSEATKQIIRGAPYHRSMKPLILTLGGTLGSVIAAWALWRALYKRKGGRA